MLSTEPLTHSLKTTTSETTSSNPVLQPLVQKGSWPIYYVIKVRTFSEVRVSLPLVDLAVDLSIRR